MKSIPPLSALCMIATMFGESLTAQDYQPFWKPDVTSPFEVSTQLRPWDIAGEGLDTIFENCRSMAGINSFYLIVVMHKEHRPFKAPAFPHNPRYSSFEAEDSTVAFIPDMKRYGTIKPELSQYE